MGTERRGGSGPVLLGLQWDRCQGLRKVGKRGNGAKKAGEAFAALPAVSLAPAERGMRGKRHAPRAERVALASANLVKFCGLNTCTWFIRMCLCRCWC